MNEKLSLTLRLLTLSWITVKRQQIHDRTASRTEWNDSYDFIVVGAGAAGCVVANRLAVNQKVTVLLLEAGGAQDAIYNDIPGLWARVPEKRPDLQWWQYTEPQQFASHAYPGGRALQQVGKVLGGSTTHNNMVFNRGNPRDFDLWEREYGAKGWSFKDVLPYFTRYENNTDPQIVSMNSGYHGTKGPVQISTPKVIDEKLLKLKSIYNSMGFMDTDINGAQQMGTMIGQSFITTNGFRVSSSTAYIDPNPYPLSLHIVTKALVTKVLFKGLTAVGVEFAKNDKPFKVFAQKEVIITAGGINSAQLLMLSGIGPKDHLASFKIPVILDLPVGNNYKNHIGITIDSSDAPSLNITNLENLYLRGRGPLSQLPYILLFLSTKSNANNDWPNIFITTRLLQDGRLSHNPALARVKSKGTVRLQSNSPYVQPLIDAKFFTNPKDYTAAVEAVSFMLYAIAQPSISSFNSYPSIKSVGCQPCPGLPDYKCTDGIKCLIVQISRPANHATGACRMGALSRNDVVVGPSLQVKGTKNVRVCDSCIMPDLPNGNLYAASLMLGEKCAQLIKDYHKF